MLTSSLFYQSSWDKLVRVGCKQELVDDVVQTKAISNPEPLYETYRRLPKIFQNTITKPWQLLILSGEVNAFDYAIKEFHIKKDTKSSAGEPPLFYAAMCTNTAQLDKALELIEMDNNKDKENQKAYLATQANNGCNVLHYAILSRNPAQFANVVKLHLDHKMELSPVANNKRNALHYAALTGNLEMLDAVIDTIEAKIMVLRDEKTSLPIEPKDFISSKDEDDYNALNYGIKSNNFQVQNRLEKLGLEKGVKQDNFYYGDVETREELHAEACDELVQINQPQLK